MAQLPFELQKLPPAALDVLRYFANNGNAPADDYDIMDGADLTERSFSKAIKRLVTKKFAEMDGARMYTLTDKGEGLMRELAEYDRATGGGSAAPATPRTPAPPPAAAQPVQRRLTVVVPEPLPAGEHAEVYVGVDRGIDSRQTDMLLRVSFINADPENQEQQLTLRNGSTHTVFKVTAGDFTQVRLRVVAYQADEFSGDLHNAGGMYVDVDVTKDKNEKSQLAAFGTDVTVLPM